MLLRRMIWNRLIILHRKEEPEANHKEPVKFNTCQEAWFRVYNDPLRKLSIEIVRKILGVR